MAHKLGEVPHVSGLLRRIARISGAGERVSDWLLKIAIARVWRQRKNWPSGGGFAMLLECTQRRHLGKTDRAKF